jgi:DNA-binding transcriptional LysR family regulator
MPISTDMLAAFVKVADRSSVSAAATELGVGKSLVSKRVAQLKGAVKATLFSRSTAACSAAAGVGGAAQVRHEDRGREQARAAAHRAQPRAAGVPARAPGLTPKTLAWQRATARPMLGA